MSAGTTPAARHTPSARFSSTGCSRASRSEPGASRAATPGRRAAWMMFPSAAFPATSSLTSASSSRRAMERPDPVDVNGIINFFGGILTPIKWVIEAILVGFHWVFQNVFHMDPAAGITWVLSIVCLVLVVRAALIPIFVRQIKSQRKMMEVAPQLKKIQDKYKGKKDQFSREAMQRETMELYRKAGTNPLSSCLPLLIQMPIFFSLFSELTEAREGKAGVGFLTKTLSQQFGHAYLLSGEFKAPVNLSIQSALALLPVNYIVV